MAVMEKILYRLMMMISAYMKARGDRERDSRLQLKICVFFTTRFLDFYIFIYQTNMLGDNIKS